MTAVQSADIQTLVVTGGHAYERESFEAAWQSLSGLAVTYVEHPAAQDWLIGGKYAEFDVVVFYDMPGVAPRNQPPIETPSEVRQAFAQLQEKGTGLLFLHHALASWPTWNGYAEMVGGRYFFAPDQALRDQGWPDSGYRQDVVHTISVVDSEHPVVAGIPATFSIQDEVYLSVMLEDTFTPLLRSDYTFSQEHFWSTDRARQGFRDDRQGWQHPRTGNCVGWTRAAGRSKLVYLQPGHDHLSYEDVHVRRLWQNSVQWLATSID